MPGTGAVTTYWCDIGTTGIGTSTSSAISAAYMPPQTTTASHSTSPPSVRTPTTPRPCDPSTVANPTTRVCCAIRTPAARAPAAPVAPPADAPPPVRPVDGRDPHAPGLLRDPPPGRPAPRRQRGAQPGRVDLAVGRRVGRAQHPVGRHEREQVARVVRRDQLE